MREVIQRNLQSPTEDIAQKKKWVIDRRAYRLPIVWLIYIIASASASLLFLEYHGHLQTLWGIYWSRCAVVSSFQRFRFKVKDTICIGCCGDEITGPRRGTTPCPLYRVRRTPYSVLCTWHITGELHTATVGTHAGSLRHTFRWDWDGMGHGSRALWVGSTHCTEYGVLSRSVL